MAGLASDPSARPATMGDLLARLATGPRRARASALAAAVVVVVGAASAVALRHGAVQDCQGAEAHLAGVWDAPRRAEIRLAFQRSGLPGAEQMVASVLRSFDSYGDKWRAGWVDACEATRVHGSQSEALMDARMLCLDDRARAWAAIGDTLAHADPAALDKAIAAMADLPSPVACADPRHLDRSSAQSPVARARSEALRGQIATIKADVEFGRTLVAKEKIAAGLAEARALHSGAFEAELLTAEGKNEVTAEPVAAVAAYHAAAQAAERAGREDLLADARVALVHALGWQLHRIDEALQWADYAQTTIDRLGDPDLAITLAGVRAEALERGAQASRALPLTEQVLVYRQQHANGPDLAVARALNQVAIDHADLYHVDVALDYFRQTVAAYEQLYGTEHLATLMVKGNLAAQLKNAGRSEEARMLFEEVIAAIERQMGRDHLRLLGPYDNLGRTLGDLGHYRESEAAIRHSIEIGEKHLGPTSPATAQEYSYLSLELTAMGRVDDALATAQHGLALLDIKAEAKEPRAFLSYLSIGHAYQEMGRCADALAAFDRAEAQIKSAGMEGELDWVAIERVDCQLELGHAPEALAAVEAALGHARTRYADDNLFLADFLVVVARARLAAGKASDALEPAQRAVATLTAHKVVGFKLVRAQFTLARVMWETQPEQRGHAVELARQALAGAQPLVHTKDTIARWLQNH
jgi:tetratricopeptide (TPR) repeat protein